MKEWHNMSAEECLRALGSGPKGLSDEEVQKAIADWGYPPKKRDEDWLTFEEALEKIKKK